MKVAVFLLILIGVASIPLHAVESSSKAPSGQLDDFNHRFAEKFYQILALLDQDAHHNVHLDVILSAHKQQLDDHEVRIQLMESYALGDTPSTQSCDCVSVAQLRAEFHSYQKNESARLAIASAVGGCLAAAVGGMVYWWKK